MNERKECDYQFEALFNDGTLVQQGDDKPKVAKEGSAFTDVLLLQDRGLKLLRFSLVHKDGERRVDLDMERGVFVVDGVHLRDCGDLPVRKRSVVFFRRRCVLQNKEGDEKVLTKYLLGWEGMTEQGQRQRRVLEIE